jgi:hypothetical protein
MENKQQRIIDIINAELRTSDGRLNGKLLRSDKYSYLRDEIYEATSCLDELDELTHRVYWILLGYMTPPICKMCNTRVRFQKQTQRFNTYCCSKCRQADPIVQDKCKTTNLIRYGVEYITISKPHQDQARLTNLARYGAEKPFQSSAIQDKVRQNTVDKYGVVSTALLPNIKEKQLATRQQKYGVDYLFQSQEFQEQVKLQTTVKYNGKYPSQLHISDISLNHLKDYNWILNKYCIELNSLTGIAEELGVSLTTVTKYVALHNIPTREVNTFSSLSINWLNRVMDAENINIQHALNGGEYIIPGTKYKADGYCKETNTIYEFHGDYWHGNPHIFPPDEYNHSTNCTMGTLFNKTKRKEDIIKNLGYNLITIWEHDYSH